jgi:hypothetical protein
MKKKSIQKHTATDLEKLKSNTKDLLVKYAQVLSEPDNLLKDVDKKFKKMKESKFSDESQEEFRDVATKALPIVGLENHYQCSECIGEHYRPFVIQFARDLVQEYGCKTMSEKALAELAAASYGRVLEYSQVFNSCLRIEYLSSEKNNYYSMIGKEVDRANRQFITSLNLLKQIKSPNIQVSVKTNAAFISQNQQINNTKT